MRNSDYNIQYEYYNVVGDNCLVTLYDKYGWKYDYFLMSYINLPKRKKKDGTLRTDTSKYVEFQKFLSCEHKLLDCGVFSFFNKKDFAPTKEWIINYATEYATFIRNHNFKDYECFELDVGSWFDYDYDFVELITEYMEKIAGVKFIRVWHINCSLRRWDKWCSMSANGRVAIGGIAKSTDVTFAEKMKEPLYKIAKKYNCKVHGLGYTKPLDIANGTHWTDSGDSTTISHIRMMPFRKTEQININGIRAFKNVNKREERDIDCFPRMKTYIHAINDMMEDIGGAMYDLTGNNQQEWKSIVI